MLEYIAWHRLKLNCYPQHKEIDQACFIGGSPAGILKVLARKGYIKLGGGKHRALRITERGQAYLNPEDLTKWDERAQCDGSDELKKWLERYRILTCDGLKKWSKKYVY